MSLVDSFHAYVYGTSFWYFLRGITRIVDPVRVIGWFRPPSQPSTPNDLELYTTRTDAFGLLTLSLLVLILAGAVPLPAFLASTPSPNASVDAAAKRPYARAAILATIFHHVTTGLGAYQHWSKPTHHTIAMDVGVYGCAALAALGFVALVSGMKEDGSDVKKKN